MEQVLAFTPPRDIILSILIQCESRNEQSLTLIAPYRLVCRAWRDAIPAPPKFCAYVNAPNERAYNPAAAGDIEAIYAMTRETAPNRWFTALVDRYDEQSARIAREFPYFTPAPFARVFDAISSWRIFTMEANISLGVEGRTFARALFRAHGSREIMESPRRALEWITAHLPVKISTRYRQEHQMKRDILLEHIADLFGDEKFARETAEITGFVNNPAIIRAQPAKCRLIAAIRECDIVRAVAFADRELSSAAYNGSFGWMVGAQNHAQFLARIVARRDIVALKLAMHLCIDLDSVITNPELVIDVARNVDIECSADYLSRAILYHVETMRDCKRVIAAMTDKLLAEKSRDVDAFARAIFTIRQNYRVCYVTIPSHIHLLREMIEAVMA